MVMTNMNHIAGERASRMSNIREELIDLRYLTRDKETKCKVTVQTSSRITKIGNN